MENEGDKNRMYEIVKDYTVYDEIIEENHKKLNRAIRSQFMRDVTTYIEDYCSQDEKIKVKLITKLKKKISRCINVI